MNTPNPLIPQGSLLQPGAKSKSKLALLVLGILAFHAVFILGILVQGCKREDTKKVETTPPPALPPLPTEPYKAYTDLPAPAPAPSNAPAPVSSLPTPTPAPVAAPDTTAPAPIVAPMAPEVPDAGTREYTIAKGDSFSSIGKKLGISYLAIAKANPGVDSSRLKVGQKIQLPAAAGTAAPTAAAASVAEPGNGSTYTVKPGDTLTRIARSHGTTVAALRAANQLKTDRINVGKKLKVPAAKSAEAPAAPAAPAVEAPGSTPSTLPPAPAGAPVAPGTPPPAR